MVGKILVESRKQALGRSLAKVKEVNLPVGRTSASSAGVGSLSTAVSLLAEVTRNIRCEAGDTWACSGFVASKLAPGPPTPRGSPKTESSKLFVPESHTV
ncbi:hypothetical protein BS47DRAFT_854572 [Hydnum rufescens UP504]|uniref:Uncharacterized protein n=1 Tax=Hydnum rufescens UP504 TaxID=1448309 RepID=A0A9P6B1I9_9AGAM|nr:hypothetical protein BS47DRAFT_854572 [Hydnum rufescens UP504]